MKRQNDALDANITPKLQFALNLIKNDDDKNLFLAAVNKNYKLIWELLKNPSTQINWLLAGAAFSNDSWLFFKILPSDISQTMPIQRAMLLSEAITWATRGNHLVFVQTLLGSCSEDDFELALGWAVQEAALNNHLDWLQSSLLRYRGFSIKDAILGAIKGNNEELLKNLLGPKPNPKNILSAIKIAVGLDKQQLLESLLKYEGANVETALVAAIENDKENLLRYLLKQYPDINVKNAVSSAVAERNKELLLILLETPKANVQQTAELINTYNEWRLALALIRKYPTHRLNFNKDICNGIKQYLEKNAYKCAYFFCGELHPLSTKHYLKMFNLNSEDSFEVGRAQDKIWGLFGIKYALNEDPKCIVERQDINFNDLKYFSKNYLDIAFDNTTTLSSLLTVLYENTKLRITITITDDLWHKIARYCANIEKKHDSLPSIEVTKKIMKLWQEKICSSETGTMQSF